jgi:tight adherence protein B
MGAVVGMVLGIGLLLIWRSGPRRPPPRPRSAPTWTQRTAELLAKAGYPTIRPQQLFAVCGVSAAVVLLLVAGVSRSLSIAVAFSAFAGYAPLALVKVRRRQRTVELRDLWPDVVDNLASAVRAGMSLPEAVAQVAVRGPEQLREPFHAFAEDYRASGRFGECLDRLKSSLADPVADRIVESLRVAREVGGTDLGRVLRTLATFLREDARARAELETRQGWVVSAARLAVAAPWAVLLLLATQSTTLAAYDSPLGTAILIGGGVVCAVAYRLMLRIGRLPQDVRVLQ